ISARHNTPRADFPSRRSSDLLVALLVLTLTATFAVYCFARAPFSQDEMAQRFHAQILLSGRLSAAGERRICAWKRCAISSCENRSEEHTSELQSRSDLVCRLL